MDGSERPVQSVRLRTINLSAQSPVIFRSRRNPLATPEAKPSELPLSSPVRLSPSPPVLHTELPIYPHSLHTLRSADAVAPGMAISNAITGPSSKWDVEDVSDSQWLAIDRSTKKSRRNKNSSPPRSYDASSSRPPSSPILRPAAASSSPEPPSIITPNSPEGNPDSEPIDWPSSPAPDASRFQLVQDEKSPHPEEAISTLGSDGNAGLDPVDESPFDDVPEDLVNDRAPDVHPPIVRRAQSPRKTAKATGAGNSVARDNDRSQPTLKQQKQQAKLEDLFSDNDDPPGPSHAPRPVSAVVACDLTNDDPNDHDEYNDFDDFPYPDLEILENPGPATTPLRPVANNIPRFFSSPPNLPPVADPITLISDLPQEDQDFYNNHWRRGADKVRKRADQGDDEDDEPVWGGYTNTSRKKPASKRNYASRGWASGGRGRGRGRTRGRGRGSARRGR